MDEDDSIVIQMGDECTLEVRLIGLMADFDVTRLEYQMRVNLDRDWEESMRWALSGRDDLGNEYEDCGGAHSRPDDDGFVEGEIDLHPGPAPGATWLDVTFTYWNRRGDEGAHTIRLALPLPSFTLAQWTARTRQYWVMDGS